MKFHQLVEVYIQFKAKKLTQAEGSLVFQLNELPHILLHRCAERASRARSLQPVKTCNNEAVTNEQ